MNEQAGSKTISVDKAALEELKECVKLGHLHLIAQTEKDMYPLYPAADVINQIVQFEEALRNINCADAHDRVADLIGRLLSDTTYHERDIAALEEVVALARDKAGVS
jgi:hypothetical protein